MRYLSVCSGIEAASVAWGPLGWTPAAFAEIERFPSAVLAHHFPDVPNHGDFTRIAADDAGPIDLLVGGTPCQSFSVAGQRGGLDDARGDLAIEFVRLAARTRARWLVWENVPGVLSSAGGRDLGTFLGFLADAGYGFAWRVLDAQWFGLAQRRKRVFLVGCAGGEWQRAAAVLVERACLRGDTPPSRDAGAGVAGCLETRPTDGRLRAEEGHLIAHTLRADGFDASEDGTGRGTPIVTAFQPGNLRRLAGSAPSLDVFTTLRAAHGASDQSPHVAVYALDMGGGKGQANTSLEVSPCFSTAAYGHAIGPFASRVRRLTPRECERLQGFPDDWTLVPYRGKPAADGPRYRAIGNSMAVPVMRWIGERIAAVDAIGRRT